ncbi:hypothetical protein C1646_772843 [Rhizophagus diaphanus]|nr:hypothetical protein C1646_772843 [Rhizophagus diaphanus] [Rhizophagus sp. MUCL 43196]
MAQNLFIDIHEELYELNTALEELQEEYKFNIDYGNTTDEGHEENLQPVNDETAQSIFTNTQIDEFYRIWSKDPLHYEEGEMPKDHEQFNEKLQKQDIEAFQKKLKTTPCCSKNCLVDIINHEIATKKFQLFQKLNKNQQNMNQNMYRSIFNGLWYWKKKWEAIRKHFSVNDIALIVHGLTGQKSNNAIPFETILQILTFVTNYANVHGLPSSGRHFREETTAVTYLPASESYASLWRLYTETIENIDNDNESLAVSIRTFCRVWQKYLPGIKFLSPRSDLCYKCKLMRFNSQMWSASELEQKIEEWNRHILWAQLERENFRSCVANSKLALQEFQNAPRPGIPNSLDFENHISWDFAEAVQIPYSSQQEGATYFKSLYKVQVFGVCEDGTPRQVNYLIPEDENVGKGADITISLVHHYFEKHGLGEKRVIIHADNCTGQNKNNAMIMYLAWRIANNLHEKITYSFMVAGHTKFTPDGFFGLFKLKLRHSEVDDMWDLVNVVKESTPGGYNIAQTVLNGYVEIKTAVNEGTQLINLTKKGHGMSYPSFPKEIIPKRITPERQWYLYEEVRQHIQNPSKWDSYCPLPSVVKPKIQQKKKNL